MARRARHKILYGGCFAHVYSRAIEHRYVFQSDVDFEKFKSLLYECKERFYFRIHHYCLMNSHFHLLISMDQVGAFSKGMKEIKRQYANWAHAEQKRYGPIWWGRFGSQLVEDERYLYACGLYIERNPVQAGMVQKPEDWKYSSSRHYFFGEKDVLVTGYDQPGKEEIRGIEDEIQLGRGPVIGSKLFKIYHEEFELESV